MDRPKLIAASLVFAATVGLSAWAAFLDKSEIVHFWVAVPAGRVDKPVVLRAAGPPVRLRPIRVDLGQRGFLKRWVQPDIEALSTHWIVNVGRKPVRIRMELAETTMPVAWEVNANFGYDPATHTFTEPLMPGRSIPNLAIDWVFEVAGPPAATARPESRCERVIYDGGLRLIDADTEALLTFIPITITRGLPAGSPSESPCDFCPLRPGAPSRPTGGDTPRSPRV